MDKLKYARRYAEKGWRLLPVYGKKPAIENWPEEATTDMGAIKAWFSGNQYNIGVATGERSGFWVLDIDGQEGIRQLTELIEENDFDFPETVRQNTGGGGVHYFFKYDKRIKKNSVKKLGNIDVRTDGGQCVLPPSKHTSGTVYKWTHEKGTPIEKAPEWLIKLITKTEKEQKERVKIEEIEDGSRNDTLYRLACKYRNEGMEEPELMSLVQSINENRCKTPLEVEEIKLIVSSAIKHAPTKEIKPERTFHDLLQRPKQRANECYMQSYNREGMLGYKTETPFHVLQNRMDGIQRGMYLLGAIANVGKTTFLINLTRSLVKANDNILVLFFSIDDNFRKIYNRLLAIESGHPINEVGNIGQRIRKADISDNAKEEKLKRVSDAKMRVDKLLEQYILMDETDGNSIEFIKSTVHKAHSMGREIVVVVDNFHKIRTDKHINDSKAKFTYLSETMKGITNNYDIVTLMTVELRKLNHDNAPGPDDLKETVDLHYDCDAAWFLHSESERKDDSEKMVQEQDKEYPIVDLIVSKNKLSDFKSSIPYVMKPELAIYQELEYCKNNAEFMQFTSTDEKAPWD